ncbi:CoA transferase [Rhodobacter sp. NTK016B]|uniref:CaiB/BaiF CoA transferase family protein n=1 Tax=Rhodobacter sp. NTK016B TaxID=2759676 RepID=UPI001A8F1BEB|nr:CaiB/BaiF CoA-transferase family protein [Rhodobacter sp. NTK016B]MBN8293064.1 CoA transferase [Rhodobacter sp. NTK016B]
MLEGIRIVEIEGLGPGPFAAMMLADLGAEVICVQRPDGPPLPGLPERNLLDRGKKTIALDLKSDTDRPVLTALIRSADGLIEGFRPGVMERLGLGPDICQGWNPRLVYGRMTGWGQDGPRAKQAGHDLNYVALSGALWYASPPGQTPVTPPTLLGDIGGGALYLVAGMLSGLIRAGRNGQGTVVDVAIVDGSAHMMTLLMLMRSGGMFQDQRGASLLDGPHWSRSYECADGGFVTVQCLEPKFYAEFLLKMSLSDDPEFARQNDPASWPQATRRLAALFGAKPRDHWTTLFDGSDACVAPVLSPSEAARDPHLVARGVWSEAGDLQPRPAPRFDGKVADPAPAPARDQHRDEILQSLGAQFSGLT